ncbi:MAG: SusD/RagB family nutrient-binding outer membrane lipoprotein, partial [Parabacteroides gordonii]|nr:SusD/RagB family nutrient-binding outer membrane lipoprotein [Parabacteroides gordonii]
ILNLANNGNLSQSQLEYTVSMFCAAQTAPSHILSYHEVLFLKAEALCRLSRNEEAKTVLKDAVIAGMNNMEVNVQSAILSTYWDGFTNVTEKVTSEEAATYFDENVAPLFDANPLKETMIQKYIAFWNADGESTECYNDVRRLKSLGEDIYEFQNTNKFPLRHPYGGDDTTTNPNVQATYGDGQYVFAEPVWWAGGSR